MRNPEHPKVVSSAEWLAARKELPAEEKRLTRARDALNAKRLELPWLKVEQDYIFDTPEGEKTLAELFAGRNQLIVKHFMLGPGWKEGCVGCSFEVDHVEGALVHLEQHDVSYVAVSRAPLAELEAFKKRMGWRFPWVSSARSDFNFAYHVSFTLEEIARGKVYYNYDVRDFESEELSGLSVFYKGADGQIFHTYSSYGRGTEETLGTYMYLDITPKGRNENGPRHDLTDWVRHRDKYGLGGLVGHTGRYVAVSESDSCCHSTAGKS